MEFITQIRKAFSVYPRWANVEANEKLVGEAYRELYETGKRPRIDHVIEELTRAGKLAVSADYANAYQEFFEKYPEYRVDANVSTLDGVLIHFCEPITLQNLEELLMPGNPRNVLSQLCITAEAAQARAEEKERSSIINEILGGLKPAVDGRGRKVCTDASGHHLVEYKSEVERVKAASLGELRQMRESRAETRRLRGLDKEQLREIVRTNQSAYSRYEELPDLYYPPGKDVGLPWSANLFRRLPTQEKRRLLAHYGDDQLTAAINAAGRN